MNWSILFTLETPHWCGGESSDREEEPAPEKEPCRGKKVVHMLPARCCPGIPSYPEAISATFWGSQSTCFFEWQQANETDALFLHVLPRGCVSAL